MSLPAHVFAIIFLVTTAQDTPKFPPPAWEKLAAAYAYDSSKIIEVKEAARFGDDNLVKHLEFTNAKGQTVTGLLMRPRAEGRYPIVLLLHGRGSDKDHMMESFGADLAAKGIGSLALDTDLHGERLPADKDEAKNPKRVARMMRDGILDYRQALDYLKTRKDVDPDRIGLLGYSMGAMMGAILSGVDDRIKATVLCVGGDQVLSIMERIPERARDEVHTQAPANYAPHISPRPLLMINGKNDTTVPEAASRALFEAAKDPKQIIWADSGHALPADALKKGIEWLADKLAKKGP